ncbi:hypothetical protein LTR56_025129 [Elasticomyces elasticus]|nr:hypothetical protein LTR56_025129 [Elasticomyces elasticus]KAK3621313.1 hypothetical protein LTR22_025248 [Elasticomyces elasticus]KAK4904860.1 hypothetical protein LTR49_025751 [Elasticomyces elasticus]KAK5741014.1 hypothetical protein LTS12_024734 [Elasticomyces elasticus]
MCWLLSHPLRDTSANSKHVCTTAALDNTDNPPAVQTAKLLTIAPELRNNIYELVFTPKTGPVDIRYVRPPSAALVKTCRKAREETLQMYRSCKERYLRETTFILTSRRSPGFDGIMNFTLSDLQSMRSLRFKISARHLQNRFDGFLRTADYAATATPMCTFERHAVGAWFCCEISGVAIPASVQVGYPMLFDDGAGWVAASTLMPWVAPWVAAKAKRKVLQPLGRAELSALLGRKVKLR